MFEKIDLDVTNSYIKEIENIRAEIQSKVKDLSDNKDLSSGYWKKVVEMTIKDKTIQWEKTKEAIKSNKSYDEPGSKEPIHLDHNDHSDIRLNVVAYDEGFMSRDIRG